MCRSIRNWVIAGFVALADLVVFLYCIPIICDAWGGNRWFMVCLFILMIVWIESLANIWRAAFQWMRRHPEALPISPTMTGPQEALSGGETNV